MLEDKIERLLENDELDYIVTEELIEFLKEELTVSDLETILNEDVLTEGKILNKIRWKLALFSLRFLKNESLDKFLEAYYSDKDGQPTEKSKKVKSMSRKEKLSKMRELANRMGEDKKEKVIQNPAAKRAEKSALISGVIGGISLGIAGASAAANAGNTMNRSAAEVDNLSKSTFQGQVHSDPKWSIVSSNNTTDFSRSAIAGVDKSGQNMFVPSDKNPSFNGFSATSTADGATSIYTGIHQLNPQVKQSLNAASSILTILASILFGAMWGGIIVAGISTVKGLRSAAKAQTLRRDEIMKELLPKKKRNQLGESSLVNEANVQITDGRGPKRKHLHVSTDVPGAGNIHDRVRETIENDKEARKKVKVKKKIKIKKR